MNIEAVARARALVGTKFRPQGRAAEYGLDCIGLACAAFQIPAAMVPADYRLRGYDPRRLEEGMRRFFRRTPNRSALPGDLLLLAVAADQLHLAVLTERGFVHADAGLRRVVETPGRPGWPIVSVWRRRKRKNSGE